MSGEPVSARPDASRSDARERAKRRRRNAAVRWAVRLVAALVLLGAGIAIGEALHDNPKPGGAVTRTTTLHEP